MWTPEQREEIASATGEVPITASEQRDRDEALPVLWEQFGELAATLQTFGVSPASMCEATNRIAEVRSSSEAFQAA